MKIVCLTAIVAVVGGGAICAYNTINETEAKTEVVSIAAPGVVETQQPEAAIEKSVTACEPAISDGKVRITARLRLSMPK